MGFIMPLPQMWLGRQPKGWVQTMFLQPDRASSSISAGSSQPSPILTAWLMTSPAPSTTWSKGVKPSKPPSVSARLTASRL